MFDLNLVCPFYFLIYLITSIFQDLKILYFSISTNQDNLFYNMLYITTSYQHFENDSTFNALILIQQVQIIAENDFSSPAKMFILNSK